MFTLPDLPYDYSALEPFIDSETMHLHHDKHHATYIKNLNDALEGNSDLLSMKVDELLKNLDKVADEVRPKVKNNAGGHYNHTLFWEMMCPADKSAHPVSGELLDAINFSFENINIFQQKFTEKALAHFGSGWAWLLYKAPKDSGRFPLEIITTPNQDAPINENYYPLLGLDVWEHAYYLKYKNVRADYITAWWNVVNWKKVEELFKKAGGKT